LSDSEFKHLGSDGKPLVVFLMGPTASGKTDLAIGLSEHLPLDLISVDSALVYKGMDVGSAKPDPETLAKYPHALVDILDPAEPYSAAKFCEDAEAQIQSAHQVGRIPLLVGGTMLYFKALRDGLADMPPTDPELREQSEQRAAKEGWPALHEDLRKIDPATADKLHPNHSVRIERALQVYHATGVPLSEYHSEQAESDFEDRYDLRQLAVLPQDRAVLHERIERRLALMFEQGFLEEVQQLYARGDLTEELTSMRAVGYRQLWSYFAGEISLDEAKQRALFATRKLAKRQLTWMRSWPDLKLLYTQDNQGATLSTALLVEKCLKLLSLEPYRA